MEEESEEGVDNILTEALCRFYSYIPFLSVSISDITSGMCLERSFGVCEYNLPAIFIFDWSCMVLQTHHYIFKKYRALG